MKRRESEGGQKFLSLNPLPFCPPERLDFKIRSPVCGKPAGVGKFCINCGATLGMIICQKCGAKNPVGTRFCGECGNKLF